MPDTDPPEAATDPQVPAVASLSLITAEAAMATTGPEAYAEEAERRVLDVLRRAGYQVVRAEDYPDDQPH